jgi:hypothetical protein
MDEGTRAYCPDASLVFKRTRVQDKRKLLLLPVFDELRLEGLPVASSAGLCLAIALHALGVFCVHPCGKGLFVGLVEERSFALVTGVTIQRPTVEADALDVLVPHVARDVLHGVRSRKARRSMTAFTLPAGSLGERLHNFCELLLAHFVERWQVLWVKTGSRQLVEHGARHNRLVVAEGNWADRSRFAGTCPATSDTATSDRRHGCSVGGWRDRARACGDRRDCGFGVSASTSECSNKRACEQD